MKSETVDRIHKAINDIDSMPLGGNSPDETMERFGSFHLLSMVAHAFLSTYVPSSAPCNDSPSAKPIGDYVTDVFLHASKLRPPIEPQQMMPRSRRPESEILDSIDTLKAAAHGLSLANSLPPAAAEVEERTRT